MERNLSPSECRVPCPSSGGCAAQIECDQFRLLYDICQMLSETEHVEAVLKPILETLSLRLGALRGSITILNRSTNEIETTESYGLDSNQKQRGRYRLGEGVTGKVIGSGNPAVIPRIADDPQFLNRTGARKNTDTHDISFVCLPIRIGEEVIGAISIDLPYSESRLQVEVQILTIIATSISQCVKMRQLLDEELDALKTENERLHAELLDKRVRSKYVVGNSKRMQELYKQMEQVSGTRATVLLLGESGVGKERIANAIHYASPRAQKAFVKINCAAIPESLIESALFGHEKGAFTNAIAQRKGYFEQADGGSIFLDEIGELSPSVQSKLLRVLQEREFERVGGSETVHVDIRVIAATNRDLAKLADEGKFREDLYYRLSVFPLLIPPLRDRRTDIMLLANHFVEKFSSEYDKPVTTLSPRAIDMLNSYSWPGNVRELENCIERAVILANDATLHSYHLPPSLQKPREFLQAPATGSLTAILETTEKSIIEDELRKTGGNMAKAAQNLEITERIMGLRVAKYNLNPKGDGK